MDVSILVSATLHLLYTPFTKVEESFNMQAMHDILYLRNNFTQYDHHEYPGVVPRTFIGPLVISTLSAPLIMLLEALRLDKFWAQYVVRFMLASVVTYAWSNLRNAVTIIFGGNVRLWFTFITISQFHFMFYMSRPLPNIFALPVVLFAVTYWIKDQIKPFIICSGIAVLIFRFEVGIFLGLLLLIDLLQHKIKIDNLLKIAIPAAAVILLASVLVDSFFWQRLLWPEGEVLWYNIILNKSSNWGTSPFLWYFYSALPRAMGTSLLLVPVALYLEPRIRSVVFASLGFVLIYSVLPHKELRFIIYVFPMLNLAAACACQRIWQNSAKSLWHSLLALCVAGHLLLNIFVTVFLLTVSTTNYPGGEALMRLHRLEQASTNVSVHIDNFAAQSGVTRFLELRNDWHYSKEENMNYTNLENEKFTHLLVEAKNKHNSELWTNLQHEFELMEYIECFNNIGIQYSSILPIRIKTKPCIGLLKKRVVVPIKSEKPAKQKDKPKLQPVEKALRVASKNQSVDQKSPKNKLDNQGNVTENIKLPMKNKTTIPIEDIQIETKLSTTPNSIFADKDINFQDLRNLALGQMTRKTKATTLKIRQLIEQHYRAKGRTIENDAQEHVQHHQHKIGQHETILTPSHRQTVKAIIKQEKIKEMIEQIAAMDLTRICNLEKMSTKDCLKQVIDKIDGNDQ